MARNFEFSFGEYYHLYNRGTEKREIFLEKRDYQRFLTLLYVCNSSKILHLSDYPGSSMENICTINMGKKIVAIGAYCCMPNHFHILVKEISKKGISTFMQKLSTGYTMFFNKKYSRTGALFEGRFRAKHIGKDEHLEYLLSYIHLNPVKIMNPTWKENISFNPSNAKKFLSEYQASSYLDYCGKNRKEGNILSRSEFPRYFSTAGDFEQFLESWLTVKVEP
ncbi:MAG: transposase [Patescibacteria group bacterium]